ncbi:TonB-dependent receptor [Leptospira fletcheri]|uniref:TonB-dependent receptor n=1 Tax=Leptospira fletcheri TaxID=2484981 RepID=A0A4R9GGA4_9LEPT|nr:energy transducer TonB [Leptospira fletcheri]TGK11710.1 TonB-dependent receptor [Leptospira fletcheri]
MDLRFGLLLSASIHLLVIVGFFLFFRTTEKELETINLHFERGGVPNLYFSFPPESGKGRTSSEKESQAGSETDEIKRLKNEIHFPPEALEQRLESDCSWLIEIGKNGEAKTIMTVKSCKYPVFENHFRKSVSRWKFQLKEGTRITVPVSFRIESND